MQENVETEEIKGSNISNIRNNILINEAYKKLKKEKRNTQVETQYQMLQLRGISCISWPRRTRYLCYMFTFKF